MFSRLLQSCEDTTIYTSGFSLSSGVFLESEFLHDQKAYLRGMGSSLSNLSNPNTKPLSENLRATIRVMPAWGHYPWREFEDIPVEVTIRNSLKLLFLLPVYVGVSLAYLLTKYLQYLPYRRTKNICANQTKLSFFSPCVHLEEFVKPDILGFWGEVKYLDPRLKSDATWFLIPYKSPGMSHRSIARQISGVQDKSGFSIFPIASLFDLKLLSKALIRVTKFHYYVCSLALRKLFTLTAGDSIGVIDSKNLGVGIARVELNHYLIESTLSKFKPINYVLHLMEGQSWEIALRHHANRLKINTIGVVHTPIREQDSQILNHLIRQDGEVSLSNFEKILCPSQDSAAYLENLGVLSSALQLVEAQRFSHHPATSLHSYSNSSKRLLYVADASSVNSDYFQHQILGYLENVGTEAFDVHIQSHPAGTPVLSSTFKSWSPRSRGEWGLVIFGPETSAYLQPEFANSNLRVYKPRKIHSKISTVEAHKIPPIEDFALLLESIRSPFILGDKNISLINRDSNFPEWKKVIQDVLQS
jgi:hypothetical protein